MTGIFLGHSGENEHLSYIRIIPGTRPGTRVTPRSQLPPNKGDRSSAYKLKEKLDMYQARHEMGLGPKMICFQRIVELELVWDMNCSFFDTHTQSLVIWKSGVCLVYFTGSFQVGWGWHVNTWNINRLQLVWVKPSGTGRVPGRLDVGKYLPKAESGACRTEKMFVSCVSENHFFE